MERPKQPFVRIETTEEAARRLAAVAMRELPRQACVDKEELFFSESYQETSFEKDRRVAAAKAICQTCISRPNCLNDALSMDSNLTGNGVWAGFEKNELDLLRRAARKTPVSV